MKYTPTIGIECHVQLATKTKLFSSIDNDARDKSPNTCISPLDYALPGTLPTLNHQAVLLAVKAGLAMNSKINLTSSFDRKHYFYPDLPTGYQITQWFAPICRNGYVDVETSQGQKRITLKQIHIEEDAGKLVHDARADASLVDYNRAGVPLVEIVSNPDFRSAE